MVNGIIKMNIEREKYGRIHERTGKAVNQPATLFCADQRFVLALRVYGFC